MISDLRFAFRQLVKSPGFTTVAIFTLALGVGSATTAFTALNAVLLRPLPFIQHQERMFYVNEAVPSKGIDSTDVCYADFLEWRKRTRTLAAIWVTETRTVVLTGKEEPERVNGCALSPGAFQAMGVQPVRGRNLLPEDDRRDAAPVALLSYGLWQRRFGGDPAVVGQDIRINGHPTKIVGVMPDGWRYPETADLWVPLQPDPAEEQQHGWFHLASHAMLKPGVTLEQARAELATIAGSLAKEFPATNKGLTSVLRPVREQAVDSARDLTLLLFGAVMFVFLIACANVSNLLLARASSRTKEIAVRLALGASRVDLVRQLLVESLLLGVLGAAGGLLLASWGVDLMLSTIPVELPFWLRFEFDPRVFGFVAGLAMLGGALFGIFPAWQASRPGLIEEIKEGGRTSIGGARAHRLRNVLVVAEIALALVLLVGAGLMMRSFLQLHRVTPGFDPRGVLTFRVGFPPAVTEDKDVLRRFFRDLLPRLAALPGVESAGATSGLPGIGAGGFSGIQVEGEAAPKIFSEQPYALSRNITPDYLATLRIPRHAGRFFTAKDDDQHPPVAIVDEAFAQKFFPNKNALGRRFQLTSKEGNAPQWLEIVGIVGNTRRWLDRSEPSPTFYTPIDQQPPNFVSVALRVRGDPAAYMTAAREAVLGLNRDMPIYWTYTFEQAIARSDTIWIRRYFGWLFAAFAGIALLLASIGIYGVMAYSVAQRTQEIGVRMALGAQPRDVIGMVVRQGARLIVLGLALGLVAAYFTAQLLAGNLYGVSPHDPPTFAFVPLLLALVALLACYVPSRRATLIDPLSALRAE
jgi:putative ABC transport system permease protein